MKQIEIAGLKFEIRTKYWDDKSHESICVDRVESLVRSLIHLEEFHSDNLAFHTGFLDSFTNLMNDVEENCDYIACEVMNECLGQATTGHTVEVRAAV